MWSLLFPLHLSERKSQHYDRKTGSNSGSVLLWKMCIPVWELRPSTHLVFSSELIFIKYITKIVSRRLNNMKEKMTMTYIAAQNKRGSLYATIKNTSDIWKDFALLREISLNRELAYQSEDICEIWMAGCHLVWAKVQRSPVAQSLWSTVSPLYLVWKMKLGPTWGKTI